jgi:hypothetical protein
LSISCEKKKKKKKKKMKKKMMMMIKKLQKKKKKRDLYLPRLLVSNKTRGDVKDHVKRRSRRRSYRYLFSLSVCLSAIEHVGMSKIM